MEGIFEKYESEVRSYCRKYPVIFDRAVNDTIFSETGDAYIDFLSVAGSMNYGHNNPFIKSAVLDYLSEDRIINSLDMYTKAKERFIQAFEEEILIPRGLDYKIMCCGPTGTNAVEAAVKLARKNKGRKNIFAFAGAFHGMTLGSLALTTDQLSRNGAGVSLNDVTFVPYDGTSYSIDYIKAILSDDHSGIEKPSAMILETVQAEGGINVASIDWLKKIRKICTENDILLIIDEIQVGNGRTGRFFSFERADIVPDMVILSKSVSGFGLPMSLLLMKRELDIFQPAEHNGTFRGNQLAFVGGTAAIHFYNETGLERKVQFHSKQIETFLKDEILPLDKRLSIRGIGMIWGIDFYRIAPSLAMTAVHKAFQNKLIVEVAGRNDSVLKIMPPLTISDDTLQKGLHILKDSVSDILGIR